MECYSSAIQYVPQMLGYSGPQNAAVVPGSSSRPCTKTDQQTAACGEAEAKADTEEETCAPSDSEDTFEDEDGTAGAGFQGPLATCHLPRQTASSSEGPLAHSFDSTEPCWVSLPGNGVLQATLPSPPWWEPWPLSPCLSPLLPTSCLASAIPPPVPEPPSLLPPTAPGTGMDSPAPVGLASGPAVQGGVQLTFSQGPGGSSTCVQWAVDAKKLRSKDKVVVSPRFEVLVGGQPIPFRMMAYPRVVSDGRSGQCFKSAKGTGSVQLKCETSQFGNFDGTLAFKLSVGGESARGPVVHDFKHDGVGRLPSGQENWNFANAVDPIRQSFAVVLEVLHADLR